MDSEETLSNNTQPLETPSHPAQLVRPWQAVVEGSLDAAFLNAVFKARDLTTIQVHAAEGVSKIRPRVRAVGASPSFHDVVTGGLVVIADADDDPDAAFRRAADALATAGFPRPPRSGEFVSDASGRRFGVFILPGEGQPGTIETLWLRSVESDPAVTCTEAFFHCVGLNPPSEKARVQAFLAAKSNAYLTAAGAVHQAWDLNAPVMQALLSFLETMRA